MIHYCRKGKNECGSYPFNPDVGEKLCFMYSEETGNRSASGLIVPKVKHSHPVHPLVRKSKSYVRSVVILILSLYLGSKVANELTCK